MNEPTPIEVYLAKRKIAMVALKKKYKKGLICKCIEPQGDDKYCKNCEKEIELNY